MQVYRINTTAFEEEDFYILTSLSKTEIRKVIGAMVKKEREEDFLYDNDDYIDELRKAYPRAEVRMYNDFETINF